MGYRTANFSVIDSLREPVFYQATAFVLVLLGYYRRVHLSPSQYTNSIGGNRSGQPIPWVDDAYSSIGTGELSQASFQVCSHVCGLTLAPMVEDHRAEDYLGLLVSRLAGSA